MRKEGTQQHFFTVRGRGFDQQQWKAVTELAEGIVSRAKEAGISADFEADARRLMVTSSEEGVSPLVIWRKGEPGIPKEVTTRGKYDTVVQSILTAAKKVAPDLFEMTSPDGRDYRRLLAKGHEKDSPRAQEINKRYRAMKDEAFKAETKTREFPNPDYKPGTKAQRFVKYITLPKAMQTQIRKRWDAEHGVKYDQQAKRMIKKLQESDKGRTDAQREKEQAADAAKGFRQKSEKSATAMTEESIRKAAIRVAAATEDKALKHALLSILRDGELPQKEATEEVVEAPAEEVQKEATEEKIGSEEKIGAKDEKESRHEEGKSVDVGEYLKSKGHHDDAAKWDKHDGQAGSKSASAVVFPEVHKLAWEHVMDFATAQKDSKTAGGSTAQRVALADRLAKKWIQDAIKKPGRVREYLGIPEGQDIPMDKLNQAIEKVKGTGNKSLLSALELAKRLKGMKAG